MTILQQFMEIIDSIDGHLPQLSKFIDDFNNTVVENKINVITDTQGNMTIDAPVEMTDKAVSNVSLRIGIIDRLINEKGTTIRDLLIKGSELDLKAADQRLSIRFKSQIEAFNNLNKNYKH